MIARLLVALSALGWLAGRPDVLTGLVMGCAFLFKFWILIFFGGLLLVLTVRREWVVAAVAGTAFALPFLCVNVVDGASLFALLGSVERQRGYSPWSAVAVRVLTTGLVPVFLAAGLAAVRRPGHATTFTFLVPAPISSTSSPCAIPAPRPSSGCCASSSGASRSRCCCANRASSPSVGAGRWC